ncbi:MAG: hypothetical protein ACR2NU_07085 [Aeoliella sp.]
MARTSSVWLSFTALAVVLLWLVACWQEHTEATTWIAVGVGTSVLTSLASRVTVTLMRVSGQPVTRMMVETFVRMALPLGVLLAIAMYDRGLINKTTILYFLPFQFITIIADTLGAMWRIDSK